MMFSRYREYIPLPNLPDGDQGSPHNKLKNTNDKRRKVVAWLVAFSVFVNLYYLYSWYTTWPLPLDNYQAL